VPSGRCTGEIRAHIGRRRCRFRRPCSPHRRCLRTRRRRIRDRCMRAGIRMHPLHCSVLRYRSYRTSGRRPDQDRIRDRHSSPCSHRECIAPRANSFHPRCNLAHSCLRNRRARRYDRHTSGCSDPHREGSRRWCQNLPARRPRLDEYLRRPNETHHRCMSCLRSRWARYSLRARVRRERPRRNLYAEACLALSNTFKVLNSLRRRPQRSPASEKAMSRDTNVPLT
jgi:hypothetical protein